MTTLGSRKRALFGRYVLYYNSLATLAREQRRRFFDANPLQEGGLPTPETLESEAAIEVALPGPATTDTTEQPEAEAEMQKLRNIVQKSQNILIESKSVFPFQLFPDTITIDRQKLTVVHRPFFAAKQTVSVPHSDVKNIEADIGPFFGSLTVTSEHFINNTQTIEYLPKRDALAIQQLVQGFISVQREGIDTSKIDDKTLVKMLDELGRGEATERPVLH